MKELVSEYIMTFVEAVAGIGIVYTITYFAEALFKIIG